MLPAEVAQAGWRTDQRLLMGLEITLSQLVQEAEEILEEDLENLEAQVHLMD
jgi:hypothetical protein